MTALMSFYPSIYDKIANQTKLVEYRRTFPKDCSYAYMYVSKPTKAICGIIYFGKKYQLLDWKNEYANNEEVSERIESFLETYRYAFEIVSFQKIVPIPLEQLRTNIPNFTAPQSYLILENNQVLFKYIKQNVVFIGEKVTNNFSNAYPAHICARY